MSGAPVTGGGGGPPSKEWVIRDPIHGNIEPTDQEIQVMDTPLFQRLRFVKQLANTHLIFPGATHTRFEHSLGTMWVAGQMAARTWPGGDSREKEERSRIIRLTGLLHDLGHGPFSHTSETIVARRIKVDRFSNVTIAADAIASDPKIREALKGDYDRVADLLQKKGRVGVDFEILDGPLDGDKFDYLIRDSYYCGIPYGNADTLRLLYSLRRVEDPPRGTALGVSRKGIEAVQYLQLARYQMHRNVYHHKTRRIADAMLVRATLLAIETGKCLDSNYFDYRQSDPSFLEHYFSLDDASLMRRVIDGGGTAGGIMAALRSRKLFKVAHQVDLAAEAKTLGARWALRIINMKPDEIKSTEEQIASEAKVDPNLVIVDVDTVENPTFRGATDNLALQTVLVDVKPRPRWISEMAGIWTSESEYVSMRADVFCPEEYRAKVKAVSPQVFQSIK